MATIDSYPGITAEKLAEQMTNSGSYMMDGFLDASENG